MNNLDWQLIYFTGLNGIIVNLLQRVNLWKMCHSTHLWVKKNYLSWIFLLKVIYNTLKSLNKKKNLDDSR